MRSQNPILSATGCATEHPPRRGLSAEPKSQKRNQNAMSQNHQTALKCASLVNASIEHLWSMQPATDADCKYAGKLAANLEQLKHELGIVLARAERKQLRRVIREKMKKHLACEGGGES